MHKARGRNAKAGKASVRRATVSVPTQINSLNPKVASVIALSMFVLIMSPMIVLGASSGSGAIWTSTSTGTTVNQNLYTLKTDVYLNGGPQNGNCSGSGLPDGDYYFQVTDPSGSTLLSTDVIALRQVKVVNGVISGVSGSGNHAVGSASCPGGASIQLYPFLNTPSSGGEYKVWLNSVADYDTDGWKGSKTDSFKTQDTTVPTQPVLGCTDAAALNYNPAATQDDGSCIYAPADPTITVTKVVVNDDHTASAVVSDFILKVGTTAVTSGVSISIPAGTYAVTETGPTSGYNATFTGDCDASGNITLIAGNNYACTITNNDIPAVVPTDLDVSVVKTVSDATPDEGDTVIYTLVAANAGPATANSVILTDVLPAGVTYVSDNASVDADTTFSAGTLTWDVGTLISGASETLQVTVMVDSGTAGKAIINSASVPVDSNDVNSQNNSSSVTITVNTPTPPPVGGGGGSTGGGGAPAPVVTPPGQVLGITLPEATPTPQVLGASTDLPRTGMPVGAVFLIILASMALVFSRAFHKSDINFM